jgi:hypothetical protein
MKRISFGLSAKEVRAAIDEINKYKDGLDAKCEELCRRLTAEGIRIAQAQIGTSGLGKYVHLSSEVDPRKGGCSAVFYMEDTQKIISEWETKEGIKSAEVSPSLMIEFGAGLSAQNPANVPGVGTGTFPGGTHGTEPGWYYKDLDGKWHHSTGIMPKMPMYLTAEELRRRVLMIAREVFGEDG